MTTKTAIMRMLMIKRKKKKEKRRKKFAPKLKIALKLS